jgi:CRP-like cAMP-binding protein
MTDAVATVIQVPGDFSALLGDCRSAALKPGVRYFHSDFSTEALLAVEEGFIVVRASAPPDSRSVITCEAGAGEILLPPAPDESLSALTTATVRLIDADDRRSLLDSPTLAAQVLEQLELALRHKQEATANLASTRHADRVRRRLLQLAERYGHIVRDGVRIDFPVSHALLAEMIGSSRETVTRALDELQRSGFVARDGSTYRLLRSHDSV